MKRGIIVFFILLGIAGMVNAQAIKVVGPEPTGIDVASGCYNIAGNVRYRARDNAASNFVEILQGFLHAKGYLSVSPTGYFGPMTLKAVKQFQLDSSIPATGFVGPLTRGKMKLLTCSRAENQRKFITYLTTNKDEYAEGEDIYMTLSALNNTDQTLTLTFPNSCQISYTIDGEYNSLAATMCAMMVNTKTILPHATATWNLKHEAASYKLSKGEHTIKTILVGYSDDLKTITVK